MGFKMSEFETFQKGFKAVFMKRFKSGLIKFQNVPK